MTPLLEVRGLTTILDVGGATATVVDDVSFSIDRGRTVALVGESGCGKSMTALSLLRIVPAPPARIVAGEVRLDGRDLLSLPEREMRRVRGSDVLGRLGGDEFAMILPATDVVEARTVVSNVQSALKIEMQRRQWPITVSIGAITCGPPFPAPGVLLQAADRLMYQAKAAGKDACLQSTWDAAK